MLSSGGSRVALPGLGAELATEFLENLTAELVSEFAAEQGAKLAGK